MHARTRAHTHSLHVLKTQLTTTGPVVPLMTTPNKWHPSQTFSLDSLRGKEVQANSSHFLGMRVPVPVHVCVLGMFLDGGENEKVPNLETTRVRGYVTFSYNGSWQVSRTRAT